MILHQSFDCIFKVFLNIFLLLFSILYLTYIWSYFLNIELDLNNLQNLIDMLLKKNNNIF